MSKAVLVMDMPSSCDKCLLFGSYYSDMTCKANGRTINYPYPKDERQNFCPLRELPNPKEKGKAENILEIFTNAGYNACIDELLGEKYGSSN